LRSQKTPGVFFIGSSRINENSYAHHSDPLLGVAVIDRFTRSLLEFFSTSYEPTSTMRDFLRKTNQPLQLRAHLAVDNFIPGKKEEDILLRDFFERRAEVTVGEDAYEVEPWTGEGSPQPREQQEPGANRTVAAAAPPAPPAPDPPPEGEEAALLLQLLAFLLAAAAASYAWSAPSPR
jgi:hypothetical protein